MRALARRVAERVDHLAEHRRGTRHVALDVSYHGALAADTSTGHRISRAQRVQRAGIARERVVVASDDAEDVTQRF